MPVQINDVKVCCDFLNEYATSEADQCINALVADYRRENDSESDQEVTAMVEAYRAHCRQVVFGRSF